MIELRWKQKVGGPAPRGSVIVGERIFQTLEYREQENGLEDGLQQPIFSEWKQIPVVCE